MSRLLQKCHSSFSFSLLIKEIIRLCLGRVAYFESLSNFIIEVSLVHCKENLCIHFNAPHRHLELVSQGGRIRDVNIQHDIIKSQN